MAAIRRRVRPGLQLDKLRAFEVEREDGAVLVLPLYTGMSVPYFPGMGVPLSVDIFVRFSSRNS